MKKINNLFASLGSVRIVKNCDLGLKIAALGLRPRAAFSRPRSQFFTLRTSGSTEVTRFLTTRGGKGIKPISEILSQHKISQFSKKSLRTIQQLMFKFLL